MCRQPRLPIKVPRAGWATISPDDVNVVAAWGGKMWQVDRATGNYVVDLPIAPLEGTQPDWSPLGGEVVCTRTPDET